MPGYVDFNYYEAFSGRVPEDVFLQYQPSAEQRLDVLTHRRAIDLPADDWRMEQVKSAVCSMIDYLAVSEELGQGIGVQDTVRRMQMLRQRQLRTVCTESVFGGSAEQDWQVHYDARAIYGYHYAVSSFH